MPRKKRSSTWQPRGGHPFDGDLTERYPNAKLDELVSQADLPEAVDREQFKLRLFEILRRYELEKHFSSRPTTVEQRAALATIHKELDGIVRGLGRLGTYLEGLDSDTRDFLNFVGGGPSKDFKARSSLFAFPPDKIDGNLVGLMSLQDSIRPYLAQVSLANSMLGSANRGRPRKGPEYSAISRLVPIYAEAKGADPTRIYDWVEAKMKRTHFYDWAADVMKPSGFDVTDDMVRSAIAARKK